MPITPLSSTTLYEIVRSYLEGVNPNDLERKDIDLKDNMMLQRYTFRETGKLLLSVAVDKDREIRMVVFPTLRLN